MASPSSPLSKAVIVSDADDDQLPTTISIRIELFPVTGVPVDEHVLSAAGRAGLHNLVVINRGSLGYGDALLSARHAVGREAFVLFSASHVVDDEDRLLERLLQSHAWSRTSVVAIPAASDPRRLRAGDLERAGCYVLTPEIFGALDDVSDAGARGFGDALLLLARQRRLKVIGLENPALLPLAS